LWILWLVGFNVGYPEFLNFVEAFMIFMRISVAAFLLVWLFGSTGAARAEGKLSGIRSEVRGGSSSSSSSSSSGSSSSSSNDDDFLSELLAPIFEGFALYVLGSPITLPAYLANDDLVRPGYFLDYPYAKGEPGYMRMAIPEPVSGTAALAPTPEAPALPGTPLGRSFSFQAAIEESHDFDAVNSLTLRASMDTSIRIGAETDWTWLNESLSGGASDDMAIGDIMATYRFTQSQALRMRTGIGVNVMADSQGSDVGFNFRYGFEWFPGDPVVVSSSFDLGSLGHAFVFRAQGHIGAMVDRVEFYGGYDYLSIGSVSIHGPVAGVQLWF
jgi:hypothetical protein